jgi:hypothetical protein
MTVAAFILLKIIGGLIIHAEFTDNDAMSNFVVDNIKTVEGVGETQTNICASR